MAKFGNPGEPLDLSGLTKVYADMTSKHSWKHHIYHLGYRSPEQLFSEFSSPEGLTRDDALRMIDTLVDRNRRRMAHHLENSVTRRLKLHVREEVHEMWC